MLRVHCPCQKAKRLSRGRVGVLIQTYEWEAVAVLYPALLWRGRTLRIVGVDEGEAEPQGAGRILY